MRNDETGEMETDVRNVLRAVIIELCFLLRLIQYLYGLMLGAVRYQDNYAI